MKYEPAAYDPAYYARTPYGQAPNAQAPYGEAPYGQTPYGQPPYGQTPYGKTSYGKTSYEQTSYGQTPYGQTPYGQTPGGQTPDPQAPYAQAPYGQAPYVQTPYGEWPYGQQYQQSGYVSVVEGDQKQKSGASSWATVAMVCAAVLVMLGIVLGTALLTDNMGEPIATTAAQEVPEVLSPPLKVVVQKPAISTGSTPSPVVTTRAPTTAPRGRTSRTAQPFTHYVPEGG